MQKLKVYAKWKAVQILTAIKNGEVPPPGNKTKRKKEEQKKIKEGSFH